MLLKQRVAWVEGMLMEPQHFQQQERYLEHFTDMRIRSTDALAWGFHQIHIDSGLLDQGKISLVRTKGIFPDGTPFDLGNNDPLPIPFDPGPDSQGQIVCLSVLMDMPGNTFIDLSQAKSHSRFSVLNADVRDRNAGLASEGTPLVATLQLGSLRTHLNLRSAISDAESLLPVARIVERTRDGRLILDDKFLPPMLDFRAFGWLKMP